MGYELLFKVGDDPLSELMEMDQFYQWSYRIAKLRGLFEKKSSTNKWLIVALILFLTVSTALLGTVAYLTFF